MGTTSAEERRKESKRGGAARTERLRPSGEASKTGAAQRALVLEPGSFRYAYRTGHAARCRDVARSLENRMETTTSVLQTREDGALSLRTSRVHDHWPQHRSSIRGAVRLPSDFDTDVPTQYSNSPMDTPLRCTVHHEATDFPIPARVHGVSANGTKRSFGLLRRPRFLHAQYLNTAKPFACQQ